MNMEMKKSVINHIMSAQRGFMIVGL